MIHQAITKRRVALIVLGVAVLFIVQQATCSQNTDAATLPVSTTTVLHRGPLTITRTTGYGLTGSLCNHAGAWVWAGWALSHEQYSSTIFGHILQYRFGVWSGSYCSNGTSIWDVNWGGRPPGHAQVPWYWDDDKTSIAAQDTSGPFRFRHWVTRMHSQIGPMVTRVDRPWLEVDLFTWGNISQSHGCGCD